MPAVAEVAIVALWYCCLGTAENASSVPNCNVLPRLAAAGFMEPRRVGARQGVSSSSSIISSIL